MPGPSGISTYISPSRMVREVVKEFAESREAFKQELNSSLDPEKPIKAIEIAPDEVEEALEGRPPTIKTLDPETKEKVLSQEQNGWASDSESELTFADNRKKKGGRPPSSGSIKKRKKQQESPRAVSRSPDITAPVPSPLKRKSCVLEALVSRLADPGVKRKLAALSRSPSPLSPDEDQTPAKKDNANSAREKRDSSATSTASSSSYLSPSESLQQIRSMMSTKTRGRGLTRVRGRGTGISAGRGRGRGAAHAQAQAVRIIRAPSPPHPEFAKPTTAKTKTKPARPRKVKPTTPNNGEEKKRRVFRKKKPKVEPVPEQDGNGNNNGILRENQKLKEPEVAKPPRTPIKEGAQLQLEPSSGRTEPDFANNNHHHYEKYHHEVSPAFVSPTPTTQQQFKHEVPAKMRHKTKHTVLIKDEMETEEVGLHSKGRNPNQSRNTQQHHFLDQSDLGLKYYKTSPEGPTTSVVLKALPAPRTSNSPPKIINPLSVQKVQVRLPALSPSKANSSLGQPNTYVNRSPHPTPVFSTTLNMNNFHKKRTQVLTPTTYQPQPDPESELGSTVVSFTASASSGVTLTPSFATASSLAARSRPAIFDHRGQPFTPTPSTSTPPSPGPSGGGTTGGVRASPGPIQRKVQPHILTNSKIHRSPQQAPPAPNANTNAAPPSTPPPNPNNNGGPSTSSISSGSGNNVTVSISSSGNSSLVQSGGLPTLGSIQVQNYKPPPAGSTFGVSSSNIPIGSSTMNMNMTRTPQGTNIIFVQKNSTPSSAVPSITPASSLTPGTVRVHIFSVQR